MLCLLAVVSCADELAIEQQGSENPLNQDKGIGELVLFSSGNTGNSSTRAVIPYMEKEGRFVCKMYYHAKATDKDTDPFDTETTPITSWLRVDDNEGNSVYWNNQYTMDADETHSDYIDYGFDSRAQYFYWRNRLDHIFLAYTDFNLLKTNKWELSNTVDKDGNRLPKSRSLFMYPEADGEKKTKVGQEEKWNNAGYRKLNIRKVDNPDYSEAAKADAEAKGEAYNVPQYLAEYGSVSSVTSHPGIGAGSNHFWLAFDDEAQATLNKLKDLVDASSMTTEEKTALKADLEHHGYSTPESIAEGTFRNYWWEVYCDETKIDPETHCVDLLDPSTVIYCRREKQEIVDKIETAPANVFDMRRSVEMTSMADQPDPLIALTKMKPTGATQEANRVRLYFKHQFSQIQVNLTKGENTPELSGDNIVSVELLGVTEKGYVFTNINPDGTAIPPSFDAVVLSKYSEAQLKKNPYGTSFNMFDMGENKQPTALKSFNAIAFGQLQAIRITWKEEPTNENYTDETAKEENDKHLVENNGKKPGEEGYVAKYEEGYTPVSAGEVVPPVHHVATYKITVDERGQSLVNLKSGYRYVYDFELRRGTIAFIRATIDGWLLSDDLNFGTSGTIKNE